MTDNEGAQPHKQEMAEIQDLKDILSNPRKIAIVGHPNPDGDCIGSMCGLCAYLEAAGHEVKMATPDRMPDNLSFITDYTKSKNFLYKESEPEKVSAMIKEADLVFCLDFNNLGRSKSLEQDLRQCGASMILIDHHPFPALDEFAMAFSEPQRSSTCEYMYDILKELDKSNGTRLLGIECANALFCGILTDTNVFSNSVTPRTLSIASEMMDLGVDKECLQQKVTGGYRPERLSLLGYLLENSLVFNDRLKSAYMIIDSATKKRFDFRNGESEGFVNIPLSIKGVEFSALFSHNDDGGTRVSLRSRQYPVNKLAEKYFGGGGHLKAAGGRIDMETEKAGMYFEECLEKYIMDEKLFELNEDCK